jgi:hypothetical protein
MRQRRSIRAYLGKEVSRRDIEEILSCAALAPSAINLQPWEFIESRFCGDILNEKISGGLWPSDGLTCQVQLLFAHKIRMAGSLGGVRVRLSSRLDCQSGPSQCKCSHLSLSFPQQHGLKTQRERYPYPRNI